MTKKLVIEARNDAERQRKEDRKAAKAEREKAKDLRQAARGISQGNDMKALFDYIRSLEHRLKALEKNDS